MMGDWAAQQIDSHLDYLDNAWECDCQEWERTERETDYLRHNLDWQNVLYSIMNPAAYFP